MLKPLKIVSKFINSRAKTDLKIINLNSKIHTNLNLCKIVVYGKFNNRTNLTEPSQILQASLIKMTRFQSVPRHEHLSIERYTTGTGEGWLVLNGSFEAEIFDIDQTSLGKYLLKKFDMILMFNGGHSLYATKKNSVLFEFKNGPFKGSDSDKIYF
jgi:hypothetical protein